MHSSYSTCCLSVLVLFQSLKCHCFHVNTMSCNAMLVVTFLMCLSPLVVLCTSMSQELMYLVLPAQLSTCPSCRVCEILEVPSSYASPLSFESTAIVVGRKMCNCSPRQLLGKFASVARHRSLAASLLSLSNIGVELVRGVQDSKGYNRNFTWQTECDKLECVDNALAEP